jgi:CrcB protein
VGAGAPDRWWTLGVLACGGAAGAVARYLLAGWLTRPGRVLFPWGTLVVNVLGCLLLGFLLTLLDERLPQDRVARPLLAVGFLGAFTTFSTFAWEVQVLAREGAHARAGLYVAASVVLGMAALYGGIGVAKAVS